MNTATRRQSFPVAVAVCFLTFAAALPRCCGLDLHSLWTDEGHSMAASAATTFAEQVAALRSLRNSDVYQPGYHLLLHGWRRLFGDSAIALRSLSALCGCLSVPLLFAAARRFFGRRHALWSMAFLGCSAFAVYYSQEARCYAWLLLVSLCQLWLCGRIVAAPSSRSIIGDAAAFGLLGAVGFFSSPVTLPFTAALLCAHLLVYADLWRTLGIAALTAMFSLPVAVYFVTLAGRVSPAEVAMSRTATPVALNAIFVGYGILAGVTLGPPLDMLRSAQRWRAIASHLPLMAALAACALTLAIAALARLPRLHCRKRSRSVSFLAWTLLFAALFGLVLALATRMNWTPRHSYYLLIPLTLLLPALFVNEDASGQPRLQTAGFVGFVGLMALNLISLGRYFFDPAHRRDDYRGAVRWVTAQRFGNDCSLSFFTCAPLLRYYGDSSTTVVITRERLSRALDSCAAGAPQRIWLSVWRDAELPRDAIASVIPARYRISSHQAFRHIGVYCLQQE